MAVTKIGTYVFYTHPNLETVRTSATTIEPNAFQNATKLKTVDLTSTNVVTINANAFSGCGQMENLIIRSLSESTLSSTNGLNATRIAGGLGGIFVPTNLVSSYKGKTNWADFQNMIYSIDDYPKTDYSTITDSWSTIVANENYDSDYAVGKIKSVTLQDGTKLYMQLIAKDKDIKSSDHASTARMTWLCKNFYANGIQMNSSNTTSGGWAQSPMRSWLRSSVLPLLPSEIQNAIVEVDKTYRCKSPNDETLTIADTIWIPSYKEVGFTSSSYVENDGVIYSDIFNTNTRRIKYDTSYSAATWWLRSAKSSNEFQCVLTTGNSSSFSSRSTCGAVFGFCIG